MSRQSPAYFFIKSLFIESIDLDVKDLRARCRLLGLDFISLKYLEGVKSEITLPMNFNRIDARHMPSVKYLMNERVYRYFHRDTAMNRAVELLEKPKVKEVIETLSLSGVPYAEIAKAVTTKYREYADEEVIEVFLHYFWNLSLLDSVEIRTIIGMRAEESAKLLPPSLRKSARYASFNDPKRLAASMPASPWAAKLALLQMGVSPGGLNLADLVEQAKAMALLRVNAALVETDPTASERAANYVSVVKNMFDLSREIAEPTEDIVSKAKKLRMRAETGNLPSVHSITGGNHTASLLPTSEDKEEGDDPE